MTYKAISQVDFDRSVQRIMEVGLGRLPAENIVMVLWKASQDLSLNFKTLIEKATANGYLDVDQKILDCINLGLPGTLKYKKKTALAVSSIANREL